MDSQIERSVLERKDRTELQSIAKAMGGKPGSRAKKAEIVDLILELAGVPVGAATGDSSGSDAPASAESTPAGGDPADTASADGAADGAEDGSTQTDDAERDTSRDRGGARDSSSGAKGDDASTGGDETSPSKSSNDTNDRNGSNDTNGSNRDNGGGQSSEDGDGDRSNEGGRRRRRRRGRDRNDDDAPASAEPIDVAGHLDLRDEGYGFLRTKGLLASRDDVYVSVKQVRQFGLRRGDHLTGTSRPASRSERNPAMIRIDTVNGADPEQARERPNFDDLTPLFPDEILRLERASDRRGDMTARIIDLLCPIGKGQRGLIVSPPKAGKTTVMKTIAQAIEANNPEVELIVLLVDERPEEVTDIRRSVKGEVVASTFDRPGEEHTAMAELTIERAKRRVEEGKDVVIILDGITRLARAYNLAMPQSGRVMSGGIDSAALYPPKKFFGAARNVEEGGSLTILATALVDTGSKMDEVIFEEFKGTGNMELRLDRHAAERRVYPAIDVDASSTRHEELLYEKKQLQQVFKLRRVLSGMAAESGSSVAGLEMLIDRLSTFKTNGDFLDEVAKAPSGA